MKVFVMGLSLLAVLVNTAWAGEVETYFPAKKWAKRAEVATGGGFVLATTKLELFTSRPGAFPGKPEQNWVVLTTEILEPILYPNGVSGTTKTFKYAQVQTADASNFVKKLSLVDWRSPVVYDQLWLCDAPSVGFSFFGMKQTVVDVCGGPGTLPRVSIEMRLVKRLYYQLSATVNDSGTNKPIGKYQ